MHRDERDLEIGTSNKPRSVIRYLELFSEGIVAQTSQMSPRIKIQQASTRSRVVESLHTPVSPSLQVRNHIAFNGRNTQSRHHSSLGLARLAVAYNTNGRI